MAKSVDDLIYLLGIMAGPDNIDPRAVPCPLMDPYAVNVAELKIGYHTDNGIKTPDDAIVSTIKSVVDLLRDHKIMISEVRPSGIEMAGLIFGHLLAADNNDMIKTLLEDSQTITPSPVITRLLEGAGEPISGPEYSQVINLWHNFQSSMLSYFDEFDILVSPVNAHTALAHDQQEDFSAYSYTTAYNLTGWPSVVIRAGTDPDGLPVGIQILARPFREDHCLAAASWLEAQLGPFPDAMPTRNLN
jgi:amidase